MNQRTRCTHCGSVYTITAQQLERSKGQVRCGKCRQRFTVTLIERPDIDAEDLPGADLFGTNDFKTSHSHISHQQDNTEATSRQRTTKNVEEVAELLREMDNHSADNLLTPNGDSTDVSAPVETQTENLSAAQETSIEHGNFYVGEAPDSPARKLWRYLLSTTLALVIALLSVLLYYQLWLNGATKWPDTAVVNQLIEPISKRFNIVIPVRKDLAHLELISASFEPHPSRPSTTLLKVHILNHADIDQAFPWLEISLTDKSGRLVSRRAIDPLIYLHNNDLSNVIRSTELKQVTIEMLALPKPVTGYEIRLLNK